MDIFRILFSVFLILWKCKELTMQNVTFHKTLKTWKDAANVCASTGGVLESNVTLLMDLKEFKTEGQDVWTGQFRTLTNWTYIRGCYLIHGKFQHFELEQSNSVELQCQMLCEKYKFYSIKGVGCYCIANISSFDRSTDCNCDGCYKVWKHRLPNFQTANVQDKDKCIATTTCEGGKFDRGYEQCSIPYRVTCDNGAELGKSVAHNMAEAECEKRDSFIKWHQDNLCNSTAFPQHWTSGTRHDETFIVRKAYLTEEFQPDECFFLKKDGTVKDEDNCNKKKFFFCRIDTNEDEGGMVSIPNIWISPQQNVQVDDSGSIAAGIVTSIIVVIAVISVLVFIHRRRLSRKKPTLHESQNNTRLQAGLPSNYETSKSPVYHEIEAENFGTHSGKLNSSRAVNNITYESANSSNLTNLNSTERQKEIGQTEYDMPKVINVTGNSSEGANSSNYCLAKPITTNRDEELDPYDINKDYDHLNNVMKKEDQITKVYDHLPTTVTDDPTYDHSNLKSALDNEDFYDHFKNDGDHD